MDWPCRSLVSKGTKLLNRVLLPALAHPSRYNEPEDLQFLKAGIASNFSVFELNHEVVDLEEEYDRFQIIVLVEID